MKRVIYKEEVDIFSTLQEPSLYQVFLHNDEFTPMEFVVETLEKIFFMERFKASMTMLEAHVKGLATCGIYSRDLAETILAKVEVHARNYDYPLTCSMEVAKNL